MHNPNPTEHCIKWRDGLLSNVSKEDAPILRKKLETLDQNKGYVAANVWLRGVIERYELLAKVSILRGMVGKEAERLANVEGQKASLVWLRGVVDRLQYCDKLITELSGEELALWGWKKSNYFEVEIYAIGTQCNAQAVKDFIEIQLIDAGVKFNHWDDNDKVAGLAARMITSEWWVRQAKRQWVVVEQVLRECGQVHRFASPYVSNWSLRKEEQKQENTRAFLEGWEATNDKGQSYTLAELSELGVSNPHHRFSEVIVRSKGLEEIAVENEHEGWFITLTCPSKYHPFSKKRRNRKYWLAGSPTVQDAHNHLNNVWKLFRTWCSNNDIKFYGLRVVEPHHAGTPHWHLMIYLDPIHSKSFLAALKLYALSVDRKERGLRSIDSMQKKWKHREEVPQVT